MDAIVDRIVDFALPRTDAGALVQVAIFVPWLSYKAWAARHDKDRLTFRIGILVFVVSLFALRTLH